VELGETRNKLSKWFPVWIYNIFKH
jgi:hypothetical protein